LLVKCVNALWAAALPKDTAWDRL